MDCHKDKGLQGLIELGAIYEGCHHNQEFFHEHFYRVAHKMIAKKNPEAKAEIVE